MVFSTPLFVFYFLPLVLGVYYALPWLARLAGLSATRQSVWRNAFLLIASYVFYGWWNPPFILLMLAITLVNYLAGYWISRDQATAPQRKWAIRLAVVISLGLLGFFKYFTFFQQNLNALRTWIGSDTVPLLQIVLPMGVSFYTFQALSYSIDVYRGVVPRARSLLDFAAYIALFPQLIAGPIVRYSTVAQQLVARHHTCERFASGVALFILGFAKKVLLANPLGEAADTAFGAVDLTVGDAWFGVVAYALQIYFDFSGYSDMAVGLGRMLGFEFLKNFDAPYRAESITDFWRRWHISLSTFLRDYLYIPLGGNRKGTRRTYVNLALVMLLGGLWHGANWTFIAWGAYHGVLLIGERWLGRRSLYHKWPRPLRVVITFVLVLLSWVLFRSASLTDAVAYLRAMTTVGLESPSAILLAGTLYSRKTIVLMLVGFVVLALPAQAHDWSSRITAFRALSLITLFGVAIMAMFSQSFNPFLYFQF
jgi:alginate O-acetyltransferase complex protein AlgI